MKRKNFKNICTIVLAAISVIGLVSCEKDDKDSLKGIEFEEDEIGLTVGDEYDLSEILLPIPLNMELPKVTYASDDKTVATVGKSTGAVKAVAEGEVVITATTSDGKHSAECIITVTSGASTYTVSGSLEYSETANWSSVSAWLDYEGKDAVTASIVNSQFSLVMPAPKSTSLELLSEYVPSGITVNPQSAQGATASFFARKGTQSAEITHVGLSGSNIVSLVIYIYSDINANITGTHVYSNGGRDVYNLQLKKGWNSVINTWDYSSNEDDFYATGSIPSNSAWITEADISSSSPTRASANQMYDDGKKQNIFREAVIKKE